MTAELFRAILNPRGPNYDTWQKLLDSTAVPLQSPELIKAQLGPEKDVPCYLLNLAAMPLKQRAHLLGFIARKFGVPVYEVEQQIAEKGFPIREVDVIVSFDMRSFV